jgi:hypothetical protein
MPSASRATRQLAPLSVVGGTGLAVLAGALQQRWLCAAALLVALAGEAVLPTRAPETAVLLRRVELAPLVRTAVRVAAVVAVSRAGGAAPSVTAWVALTLCALLALLAVVAGLRLRTDYRRTPAIETRNVPLDALRIPPGPPAALVQDQGALRTGIELVAVLPAALATSPVPVWAFGGLALAALLGLAGVLERASRAVGGRLGHDPMIAHVRRFLQSHRPRVLLYFSGTPESAYQVNMWLATLERLHQPAAVVLRERSVLAQLGPTSSPVLCVPSSRDFMALHLADVRVGLFTANVGKNIHLLREPGLMSTFIGHGDSDKNASFNPVTKGFDEVWVAGPAGRDRYRRADVGVREEQLVEVGRPQLDVVHPPGPRPPGWVSTVLYAPTWEGWNAEQEYGSLTTTGPLLVRAVLDSPVPLRLIYRPHPFTGQRDPAMAAADREITALLEEANRRRGRTVPQQEAHAIGGWSTAGDAGDRARDARPGVAPSAIDAEATAAREDAAWFAQCPPDAHLVVRASGASLFACFDEADLLVTDISSVLSDFVASGKPYAVCDPSGSSPEDFVRTFPSAAAAVVVGPRGEGLPEVLALATGAAPDVHAAERRRLAAELLGPGAGNATERFADAVDALAARADARVAGRTMELHAELDDDEAGPPDGALDGAPDGASDGDDGGAADGPAAGSTVSTTTHRT